MLHKRWSFFDKISTKYDLVNDLITFGSIRFFRRLLASKANPGQTLVELAAGTGANIPYFISKFERIICVEPSQDMLDVLNQRFKNVITVNKTAEDFVTSDVDTVVVTFGFRNFSNLEVVVDNIRRMLKNGGQLLVMDVFKPKHIITKVFLKKYFDFFIIPLANLITNQKNSYEYFKDSIYQFLNVEDFLGLLQKTGFSAKIILNFFGLGLIEAKKLPNPKLS